MFSTIDQNLFPNECVVLEIEPHTRYVYPIFKNGSSSLGIENSYRQLSMQEIAEVKIIDVFVRDPHLRFLSGVQTFLKHLGSSIDRQSALFFIKNYLYLNRHYCPQLYWLINLSRFTNAKMRLLPIDNLLDLVSHRQNKSVLDPQIESFFKNDEKIKFFNEVDEVLTINLINQTVTLQDIFSVIKTNYGSLYNEMFGIYKNLNCVLPKT